VKIDIALYPTSEQIEALIASKEEGPVVMLNMLRFKPEADERNDGLTGKEAYQRYAAKMIPFVTSKGGRLIWAGRIDGHVVGKGGEVFEMMALVEYPSRKAFIEIATDPYVEANIGLDRASGLEGQWLIACTAGF